MNEPFRYRGRVIGAEDIAAIGRLIAQNPQASRRQLSVLLCRLWDWRQRNGAWRDMVCRGLMLALHRAGHIQLPACKHKPLNPLARRKRPATDFLVDQTPLRCPLRVVRPLRFCQVRRTAEESLFNGLVERYHYLGYSQPVGEHLKYIVYTRQQRPIACLAWSSAPWHMGPRDRYIGWSPATRRRYLHLLAYNSRFLILPWVQIPHLASHILGRMARQISADWQRVYGHPICYLETFVDRERYKGTSYQAANWLCLGQTTGRGIKDKEHRLTRSRKDVLGYPLSQDFRRRLGVEAATPVCSGPEVVAQP